MRLDVAATTDTEAGPRHAADDVAELSIVWLSPDSGRPPFSLDWKDDEQRAVGRDETCAVCLSGPDVSRRHAVLQRSEPGAELSILDLDSRNGTRVNGRVVRTARLARGDVVRFGGWVGVVAAGFEPFSEVAPGLFGGGVMKRTLAPLEQAAKSDLPIILQGETGTGKEVVARAIHAWSGRAGSMVAVNCAALPEGLAEAELFGYRRGAFTGADRASAGLFRSADGGTLLLDEISDLSLPLQAKLLRAIEQREVLPLGESRPVPIDVRIVVAGQESLLEAVKDRRFRADLLARLDGMTLRLPPFRERREDVAPLFSSLWKALGDGTAPTLEFDFVEQLAVHDWPLNVRELVLLVRRLRVFHEKEPSLRAHHLPPRIGEQVSAAEARPAPNAPTEPKADDGGAPGERVELPELIVALRASQGNVARASALLGITRQRAYRLIEGYAVDLDAIRK
jgi:transcriptional regulator with GAF, ATPase, and Fis domain